MIDKLIKINDKDSFVWNTKGYLFLQLKEPAEALKCFDKSIELDPHNENAFANKAICLEQLRR